MLPSENQGRDEAELPELSSTLQSLSVCKGL